MAPMTERFELRLDEQILASIDKWRTEQRELLSRAEAIRRLIVSGISRDSQSVQLSYGDRLIVTILRDIVLQLKNGNDESAEIDPDFIKEVLNGGHYWSLKWEYPGLFHDHEDDPNDVSFVVDVMELWDFLEEGYEALSKKDKERVLEEAKPFGTHVQFHGFDGNNEATHISISRFLVEKMGHDSIGSRTEI